MIISRIHALPLFWRTNLLFRTRIMTWDSDRSRHDTHFRVITYLTPIRTIIPQMHFRHEKETEQLKQLQSNKLTSLEKKFETDRAALPKRQKTAKSTRAYSRHRHAL